MEQWGVTSWSRDPLIESVAMYRRHQAIRPLSLEHRYLLGTHRPFPLGDESGIRALTQSAPAFET